MHDPNAPTPAAQPMPEAASAANGQTSPHVPQERKRLSFQAPSKLPVAPLMLLDDHLKGFEGYLDRPIVERTGYATLALGLSAIAGLGLPPRVVIEAHLMALAGLAPTLRLGTTANAGPVDPQWVAWLQARIDEISDGLALLDRPAQGQG